MFEFQHLLGPTDKPIALQTRRGNDIANSVGPELTDVHRRRFALLMSRSGKNWQLRANPDSYYNCSGHVWAARRTCIYDLPAWKLILRDDGYRRIRDPLPDDLVVYIESDQDMLHVGRVVELREGIAPESPKLAWVVSKLNDWGGEIFHFVHDLPFASQGLQVRHEFWTDRREGTIAS